MYRVAIRSGVRRRTSAGLAVGAGPAIARAEEVIPDPLDGWLHRWLRRPRSGGFAAVWRHRSPVVAHGIAVFDRRPLRLRLRRRHTPAAPEPRCPPPPRPAAAAGRSAAAERPPALRRRGPRTTPLPSRSRAGSPGRNGARRAACRASADETAATSAPSLPGAAPRWAGSRRRTGRSRTAASCTASESTRPSRTPQPCGGSPPRSTPAA